MRVGANQNKKELFLRPGGAGSNCCFRALLGTHVRRSRAQSRRELTEFLNELLVTLRLQNDINRTSETHARTSRMKSVFRSFNKKDAMTGEVVDSTQESQNFAEECLEG